MTKIFNGRRVTLLGFCWGFSCQVSCKQIKLLGSVTVKLVDLQIMLIIEELTKDSVHCKHVSMRPAVFPMQIHDNDDNNNKREL